MSWHGLFFTNFKKYCLKHLMKKKKNFFNFQGFINFKIKQVIRRLDIRRF